MNKKEFQQACTEAKLNCRYDGKEKTMYITGSTLVARTNLKNRFKSEVKFKIEVKPKVESV